MKTFTQPGETISLTAPADVTAGNPVQVGQIFGLAVHDALTGAAVEVKRTGVHAIDEATSGETVGGRRADLLDRHGVHERRRRHQAPRRLRGRGQAQRHHARLRPARRHRASGRVVTFGQLISDSLDTCKAVFGEEITLHPAGGSDSVVSGLYKEAHQELDPATGDLVVTSSQPTLRVKIADLPAGELLQPGSEVTAKGTRFQVIDQHPVGYGDALLVLQEVRAS